MARAATVTKNEQHIVIVDTSIQDVILEYKINHELCHAKAHLLDIPKPNFPGEIGEFLIRKLVHCAPSLDACKQLIFKYEDHDVYKLAQGLNEGVVENRPEVVGQSSNDLSLVLADIRQDKKFANRVKGLKIGVPVVFGVVGTLAGVFLGGIGGLLSGLGFSVGDKFIGGISEGLAEKIAKLGSQNWEVILYDFKKKYGLDTSLMKLGKK